MLMDLIADANPERVKFLSSELTLAEVMVKPLQARDDSLVETYKGLLFRSEAVSLVPVSLTILMQAAVLRSRYPQLKLPDAIHLATAQTGSASQFVTDDRQLLAAVERTGTILSVPFDVVKPSALIAIARA
jgi:predicted nucleic acid-binding protein